MPKLCKRVGLRAEWPVSRRAGGLAGCIPPAHCVPNAMSMPHAPVGFSEALSQLF